MNNNEPPIDKIIEQMTDVVWYEKYVCLTCQHEWAGESTCPKCQSVNTQHLGTSVIGNMPVAKPSMGYVLY